MPKAIKELLDESEHKAIQEALGNAKDDADTLSQYSIRACFGIYPGGEKGECPRAGECLDKSPDEAAESLIKCMRERGYTYKKDEPPANSLYKTAKATIKKTNEPDKIEPLIEPEADEDGEAGAEAPPGFDEDEGEPKDERPDAPENLTVDGSSKDAILSIMNNDPVKTGNMPGEDDNENETVTVIKELLSNSNMRQKSNINENHATTFSEVDMANMYQAMAEGSISITSLIYTASLNERKISVNGEGGTRIINALRALGGLEPLIPLQKVNGLMVQK
jgi:hypothetical protein